MNESNSPNAWIKNGTIEYRGQSETTELKLWAMSESPHRYEFHCDLHFPVPAGEEATLTIDNKNLTLISQQVESGIVDGHINFAHQFLSSGNRTTAPVFDYFTAPAFDGKALIDKFHLSTHEIAVLFDGCVSLLDLMQRIEHQQSKLIGMVRTIKDWLVNYPV